MSDVYDDPSISSTIDDPPAVAGAVTEPSPETASETPPTQEPVESGQEARQEPPTDPALSRFASCRWHETQDTGASYCSHRDVLPFAGKNGFSATAWCPECAFYKVKRTVKRRTPDAYDRY